MKFFNKMITTLFLIFFSCAAVAIPIYRNGIPTPSQTTKKGNCYYIKRYSKKHKRYYYIRECPVDETSQERVDQFLNSLTPQERADLSARLEEERSLQEEHYGISFYQPTYVLPFYYTGRPYNSVYAGTTPDNQRVHNEEFKAQLSFKFPIWLRMFNSKLSLNMYYTQLSYWQFYARSQWFRETDYEPALYFSYRFVPHWLGWLGIVHESNGRGGNLERSWNRLFVDIMYTRDNFIISIRPWILIFKKDSVDLHNPNIAHFLGYERIVIAYQFHNQQISLMLRNTFESGFSRGAIELDYSFPIHGVLRGYIQFFSGYGQSLIEYDHYTNSAGVGIILNNWV